MVLWPEINITAQKWDQTFSAAKKICFVAL